MNAITRSLTWTIGGLAALTAGLAVAEEVDPLSLQSAAVSEGRARARQDRIFLEAAAGNVWRRDGEGTQTRRRLSFDYSSTFRLGDRWQATLSDRIDHVHPSDTEGSDTLNSLREAFVTWRSPRADTIWEVGRINLRTGSGYGFNPTDYFRDGAIRLSTTTDPLSLRENRLGTVMLRGQRLWERGSVSLALAPKLDSTPSDDGLDLDLGATNSRNRMQLAASAQPLKHTNVQLLWYAEEGKGSQFGVSSTALLSDSIVGHFEASHGRDRLLATDGTGREAEVRRRSRAVAGFTVTLPSRLSVTAEYAYNGFALDRSEWNQLAERGGVQTLGAYLLGAQSRQDNAARRSWFVYATQKDLIWKNVDLTALARVNADDHSRLSWIELRKHWKGVDGVIQIQSNDGRPQTEHGITPARSAIQLMAVWFL